MSSSLQTPASDFRDDITHSGGSRIRWHPLPTPRSCFPSRRGCADSHPLLGDLKDYASVLAGARAAHVLRLLHVPAQTMTRPRSVQTLCSLNGCKVLFSVEMALHYNPPVHLQHRLIKGRAGRYCRLSTRHVAYH